jgi:hypothetical protein
MEKEKQIEEMAKLFHLNYDMPYEFSKGLAEFLIDEGYRKASEIFAEIEKRLAMYSHIHKHAKEAYQVTEEYADGSPVEMTSVWDACRLEHNGYDDYETMCQLQDNIGYIEKSRLLKEFEGDIAYIKKKFTEGE